MKRRDAVDAVGQRLRVIMGAVPEPAPEQGDPEILPPEVEFTAYAEDCLLRGYLRIDTVRLTDLLNAHEEFELVDVQVESLAGDRTIEVKDVVVTRDELLIVQAVGPRGERERRVRTRQHPLAMQVGPYHVRGYLHTLPGTDPIASFRHRKPMVPLTDASIEYELGGTRQRRRVATLIVNRQQLDSVVRARDAAAEYPDLVLQSSAGPLAKDLTGTL